MRTARVRIKFYSDKRTGLPSNTYRPHIIVDGNAEMLGVEFIKHNLTNFDVFGEATIKLVYDGLVDYSELTTGTSFKIAEGAIIVGEGCVIKSKIR